MKLISNNDLNSSSKEEASIVSFSVSTNRVNVSKLYTTHHTRSYAGASVGIQEREMTKIPDIADIIACYANQDKSLYESAADLGAMIMEMEREEECCGMHSKRLAELKKLAALQERVVMRMLDGCVEGDERPKGPRLRVVK
jgi:hypothetical protein